MIESCASRVFLPNHRANEPGVFEVYQQLGLNDRQIDIINQAIPKRQYYYSSPLGNTLFDLALGDIALAFCAVNQSKDKKLVERIIQQYGKEDFCEQYLLAKFDNQYQDL